MSDSDTFWMNCSQTILSSMSTSLVKSTNIIIRKLACGFGREVKRFYKFHLFYFMKWHVAKNSDDKVNVVIKYGKLTRSIK